MIWCRFETSGAISYGTIEGRTVTAFEGIPWGEHRATSESARSRR